jgi:hypothetical protein
VDLFVNDLSLHGQFSDHQTFRRSLDEVIQCRACAATYRRALRVPRSIIGRPAIGQADFRQAVQMTGDKNFVSLVISWIAKNGPFVEDDLLRSPGEYLDLNDGTVVSEEAIGEAATRHFQSLPAGLVSFAPSTFQHTPIEVHWHRDDGSTVTCDLSNYWAVEELERHLEGERQTPATWEEFIEQLPARFPNLTFSSNLEQHLDGETFSPYVVERTFFLLGVLNELKTCFDAEGRRTARGEELMDNFFRRERARFSDASEQEKNDPRFRAAMTFRDPDGAAMECFWHGKIQTPPYRIHFSYPIEQDAPLYICYIGQKLTKK